MICSSMAYPIEEKKYSPFPKPDDGYITDHAGLLTSTQKQKLQDLLYTVEKDSGIEIIVVTINSLKDYPGTRNDSIEDFAFALFNTYRIGNALKNNGILLLISFEDRKARIELGAGYGHNRDADASLIMQDVIVPEFKKKHYDQGIIKGTKAIIYHFSGMMIIPGWIKLIVAILIPIVVLISISLLRNGRKGWGWICMGFVLFLILTFVRLMQKIIRALPEDSSAGGSDGFGGGSSGGGGATGRW